MPKIIAEVSSNHLGSLEKSLLHIEQASKAGCDLVKFQLFDPETDITLVKEFDYPEEILKQSKEDRETISKNILDINWLPKLKEKAELYGIDLIYSCSDVNLLDLADKYSTCSIIKIASCDATNLQLLKRASELFEEFIISTGAIDIVEMVLLNKYIRDGLGYSGKVTYLYCISEYPTPPNKIRLKSIELMKDLVGEMIGYSDHTKDIYACIAAINKEANYIEKHFSVDDVESADLSVSCSVLELKQLVEYNKFHGEVNKDGLDERLIGIKSSSSMLRRSPYSSQPIHASELVNQARFIRPGLGPNLKETLSLLDMDANIELDSHWKY